MGDAHVVFDDLAIAAIGDDARVQAVVDRVAADAVRVMKLLCPVSPVGPKHRSGNLRSSIHAFRGDDHLGRWTAVGPSADYAPYVEDDTRPHEIVSHGPWPLRDEYGHVFGHRVWHPGTRGQHFVRKTAESFDGKVYRA